jgi:RNase adapter protein RapZ
MSTIDFLNSQMPASITAQVVLITGISGSGKSVALAALEDSGYYCIDNLPPELVPRLLAVCKRDGRKHVAIAVDVRSVVNPESLSHALSPASHDYPAVVLFLEASTQSLVQRYSETRRRHPLARPQSAEDERRALMEAIELERSLLSPVRNFAQCLDTTHLIPSQLRAWVKQAVDAPVSGLSLVVESFGFKHGMPMDADFVFDARLLPNPYYELAMRSLTGLDRAVNEFLANQPVVNEFTQDIIGFVDKWMKSFEAEQRSYLTVAIGCTGGQHRSVFVANRLAEHFRAKRDVIVRHRDMNAHLKKA